MPKRTTVTLDDDVASKLDHETRRSGAPFREVLNGALRRGLDPRPATTRKRFKVRPRNLGAPRIALDSTSHVLEVLDALERK
jgi:hypothetical protein